MRYCEALTRMKVKKIWPVESRWLVCNSFDRKEVTEWLNFDFARVRESVTCTHTYAGTFSKYHRKPEQTSRRTDIVCTPVHRNLYSWPTNHSSRHVSWVIVRIALCVKFANAPCNRVCQVWLYRMKSTCLEIKLMCRYEMSTKHTKHINDTMRC